MKFSERKGYTQVKNLQLESINEDLTNSLWTIIYSEIISNEHNRNKLFLNIWCNFYKKPIDTFPKEEYNMILLKKDPIENIVNIIRTKFYNSKWFEKYDFLEFLGDYLSKIYAEPNPFIISCNKVLEREKAAYRFVNYDIVQITEKVEIAEILEAVNHPIDSVKAHITQALDLISDRKNPDYRNSMKESISAIEAICKLITNEPNTTLGRALNYIQNNMINFGLHNDLIEAYKKLYHYTSDSDGIRHSIKDKPNVTFNDAKYFLVICSAFVNYLVALSNNANISLG